MVFCIQAYFLQRRSPPGFCPGTSHDSELSATQPTQGVLQRLRTGRNFQCHVRIRIRTTGVNITEFLIRQPSFVITGNGKISGNQPAVTEPTPSGPAPGGNFQTCPFHGNQQGFSRNGGNRHRGITGCNR